jgi:hypothetical protein
LIKASPKAITTSTGEFRLNGVFVPGSRGTSEIPWQPPRYWNFREVTRIEHYTIEFLLKRGEPGMQVAVQSLPYGGTELTQQITVREDVAQAFGPKIHGGMNRIAIAVERAYAAGGARSSDSFH